MAQLQPHHNIRSAGLKRCLLLALLEPRPTWVRKVGQSGHWARRCRGRSRWKRGM